MTPSTEPGAPQPGAAAGSGAPPPAALKRRLGFFGAVVIGLGSMVGAGVFTALGPASAHGAAALLMGLGIAAVVAFCNATSSAQLAAQYPTSGGSYFFGYKQLGAWPGFLAGWAFVVGKTASAAAMALGFAAYVAPEGWDKPVAVAAVLCLCIINLLGITRTALATGVLLLFSLSALCLVIARGLTSPPAIDALAGGGPSLFGVLQSGAFLFFAFAGYARLATLGEEVKSPSRTIPRAVLVSLAGALLLYVLVAVALLRLLGAPALASTQTPVADAVATGAPGWAPAVVQIGAAAATLGALLALIAGVGRTMLAMARQRDLPASLAAVSQRFGVPHRAEVLLALVVCLLVVVTDLRGAIGFSSFGVLLYYLITNASAWTQSREHRRFPRFLSALGAMGCVCLMFALPWGSIVSGLALLGGGVLFRALRLRLGRRS